MIDRDSIEEELDALRELIEQRLPAERAKMQ